MEVPQQPMKQMKEQQTQTCKRWNKPIQSVGGDERKTGMDPQAAEKQSGISTKPSRERLYMSDRVMYEAAKKLSPEEMAALEIDIFKPLDFYEILFNRMKKSSNGRVINNISEL